MKNGIITLLYCGWILWTWSGHEQICYEPDGECVSWEFTIDRPDARKSFETQASCEVARIHLAAEYQQVAEESRKEYVMADKKAYRVIVFRPPECWPAGHVPSD